MTFRMAALFGPILFTPVSAMACELAPGERPEALSAYVTLAETCLEDPPTGAVYDDEGETYLFERVNAVRAQAGLAPLAWREEMRAPARFHSLDQAWNGTFGHAGSAGRSPSDRLSALDRSLIRSSASENVAMASGVYDPDTVVDMLQNGLFASDGHRANMLDPDATHMAAGVVRLGDTIVVTQVFARLEGRFHEPLAAHITPQALAEASFALSGGWQATGTWLAPPGEEAAAPVPADSVEGPGAFFLRVRGEQRMERGYRFIYLPGPDIELSGETAPEPALRRLP